jgi:bifunctional enzyme CysN/CysC
MNIGDQMDGPGKVKVVVVGHVDHGKSTLIGRLMHETGALRSGQLDTIRAVSQRRGSSLEWAFLLDALQVERDQGVTVETTRVQLRIGAREYLLIDAPGHKQFIKNMITGAADADAALLIIDCQQGIQEQTLQHLYLLDMLGVRQTIVVFNKMDLVKYSEHRFNALWRDLSAVIDGLNPKMTMRLAIPVCARDGDGLTTNSAQMPWYRGPSLIPALDAIQPPEDRSQRPLRVPVQDVYRFGERRMIVGRVEAGVVKAGDTVLFSPSNRVSRIATIESWNASPGTCSVTAGQCVAFTLADDLFIEPGEVASHPNFAPQVSDRFHARLFWLGEPALTAGEQIRIRVLGRDAEATVERVAQLDQPDHDLSGAGDHADGMAEVIIRTRKPVVFDAGADDPQTARFAILGDCRILGGGIITRPAGKSTNIVRVPDSVTLASRWQANGHKSGVLWLTGLSCSGKSTLATRLEALLFSEGFQVATLDGDNLRFGLNADLGFLPKDRAENIRRAGEVAALFAERGFIVIAAFISPYEADRARIRSRCHGLFHEIYVSADVSTCEARDDKGLYQRARKGEIEDFTGISAPYEVPLHPELVIDTARQSVSECLALLASYARKNLALKHVDTWLNSAEGSQFAV